MPRAVVRLLLACWLLMPAACAVIPKPAKPARAAVSAGSAAVSQSGAAEVPARATVAEKSNSVPLPAGSELLFDVELGRLAAVKLSQASTLTTSERTETAEAPRAFTPPAPPSPAEIAQGKAVLWAWAGLIAGAAAGLFGLVRGWDFVALGGATVAIACACAIFVVRHPAVFAVVGIGAGVICTAVAVWHLRLKRLAPPVQV